MGHTTPTVVILGAGKGTRLGPRAAQLNKALFPVDDRPVLSHILEQFPDELPLVIAVGHLSSQIRDYVSLAYPQRSVRYVEISGYDKPGSGPAASLLRCQPYVPGALYLTTVDTLILDPLPPLENNWIGISRIEEPSAFCTVAVDATNRVRSFADKQKETTNRLAFIGLAGIVSDEAFWLALASDTTLIAGERQLSNGLRGLLAHNLYAKPLHWLDTGSLETLHKARRHFHCHGFDFSKDAEETYVLGDRVIKWFQNTERAKMRAVRAQGLAPCVPPILGQEGQFVVHKKIAGKTLYHALTEFRSEDLFNWLEDRLWTSPNRGTFDEHQFQHAVKCFYQVKTSDRLRHGLAKAGMEDTRRKINGVDVPSIGELLRRLDWDSLITKGLPSRIHGDLQFDNILLTQDALEPFMLIDWREEFGGIMHYGDRYYDLAKLNGGLSLNYAAIKAGAPLRCDVFSGGQEVTIADCTNEHLKRCKSELQSFCSRVGYDVERVEMITALIYLNMSPLHAPPFNAFLVYYGQLNLAEALEAQRRIHL